MGKNPFGAMGMGNASKTPGTRRHAACLGLMGALLALGLAAPCLDAGRDGGTRAVRGLPITELSEDEAILHALNRLGFGPRPGDIERVRQMGVEKWIAQQLHPEKIDDSAARSRLERYPTLAMSANELLEQFPNPAMAAKAAGLSREEYRKQQEKMTGQGSKSAPTGQIDPNNPPVRPEEARGPQRIIAELSMAKLTRAVYSESQLEEVMADFWFNHFNVFAGKGADRWLLTSYDRDTIRPHVLGKFRDLLDATAKSPAMLFYLDNWLSADPKAFERLQSELAARRRRFQSIFGDVRVGRPGRGFPAQGRFPPKGGQRQPGQPQKPNRGLNENYARELMELHTLGVDGGYTQQDVMEVARCFTGWTMQAPRRNPQFHFDERLHDTGSKVVLGHTIHAGGMKDGEQALDLLARHPSTAKFISTKLARRFVSDQPPQALVDRMAKTFRESDGDIRAVLHTMIYSPEFWSREANRAKIKTPFELVASAARAVGAELESPMPLVMWTARIGEPLYMCQPPTGYADKAEAWVNTGALLNRLNFALALAGNRLRGTRVDLESLLGGNLVRPGSPQAAGDPFDSAQGHPEPRRTGDPKAILDRAVELFLAGQVSPSTRATLEKQLADPEVLRAKLDDPVRQADAGIIAGLVLGAPEFQRR